LVSLQLDHNVSYDVVSPLRWAGHDVRTARELGFTRLTDDALLLATVRAGRMLATHNRRDFMLLHDAWVTWPAAFGLALPSHPGILVLQDAPPRALSSTLESFLDTTPAGEIPNNLFWWHHREGWRRRLLEGQWEPYPQGPR
jgi:hypothetical protein